MVVVGGGVMGVTLAYTLARREMPVTLLEGGGGPRGASGVPVALLNPYRGRSARASDFDLAALAATWALVEDLEQQGLETGVHRSGVVRVAPNAKQAKTWAKRDGVNSFGPDGVPRGFHAPFGGFIAASGGWLEPQRYLAALTEGAVRRGATVLTGHEVLDVSAALGVRTNQGDFQAEQVVLCTGSSLTLSQGEVGLEQVAGEVVGLALQNPEPPLPYPLAGAVYGVQVGGAFFLGGNHRAAGVTDEHAPTLLQRAGGWFVPALRDAEIGSVWHGVRVTAADHLPVVRPLRPGVLFVGGLAGRGFLAAALVAQRVSDTLLGQGAVSL